ncbi:oligosaccharide flippase family protein [Halorubrum ezzemoulense]|uniref:oligosaccharide flippase family protein n=1 Tax=Halorubrum ezzemoulense TaxID=337243 RepID=UPI00232B2540|nr:polysaccharide biosynthesis C-terminal domain-containing protein [Halorubrum ezzemoulense]MDB2260622.1 oligosaccharide flippase family protein [Halorubrum ezzemoulense]MDB2268106.1 oligosaccharide flippase family protein [Halorubrum ezzemoulense]
MKLGQTSIIDFVSNFVSSVLGFVATVYIARILGPEPLGIYQVTIGLVSWLAIFGEVGLSRAISKRVSEGSDPGKYAAAGVTVIGLLFAVLAVGVFFFREEVAVYVEFPASGYMILILLVVLLDSLVSSLLIGLKLVHINGLTVPIKTGSRAVVQIGLIVAGASTAALFIGHIFGFTIVVVIGGYYVLRNLPSVAVPEQKHFEDLFDFAKYSWLGNLQSRMFSYTDVLVLGYFVSSGLIGIYAAAWNIGQFLILFSGTLQSTLFPEMSEISTKEDAQAVSRIVEQSLMFGGLFLIPGLFGGILLGERLLRIYGPEFPRGAFVLSVLIVANLFMGYQTQLMNTLNAIDRPDLAFRVNVVFVVANVTLNVVLISLYGWVGAAVATASSIGLSLVLAYRHVNAIIEFDLPVGEIARQWIAGILMAGVVYGGLRIEETYRLIGHNFAIVVLLVIVGASIYFTILLGISTAFRKTVDRNVPVALPFVSK